MGNSTEPDLFMNVGRPSFNSLQYIDEKDYLQTQIRNFYIYNIESLPTIRQSVSSAPVSEARTLDATCSNVPQVWNTIVSDEAEDLVNIRNQIIKILPDITSIQSPLRGNQAKAGIKEHSGSIFDLANTSMGNQQICIIVTKIITCPNDSVILIEEPEIFLHASAQRNLKSFIEEQSKYKQFLITTHSTIFATLSNNTRIYLVKRDDRTSSVNQIEESKELKLIKNELGHNNIDMYGYNVVVLIEGDSEEIMFPILANALGYDFYRLGIKILNVKGNSKATKIEQFLDFLKESDTVPYVILDGNKNVKSKIEDWVREGKLPKSNFKIWDKELEDLFDKNLIIGCLTKLDYKGMTIESINGTKGSVSIVHKINKIIHDTNQSDLDKPALSELIAEKLSEQITNIPPIIKDTIENIVKISKDIIV